MAKILCHPTNFLGDVILFYSLVLITKVFTSIIHSSFIFTKSFYDGYQFVCIFNDFKRFNKNLTRNVLTGNIESTFFDKFNFKLFLNLSFIRQNKRIALIQSKATTRLICLHKLTFTEYLFNVSYLIKCH